MKKFSRGGRGARGEGLGGVLAFGQAVDLGLYFFVLDAHCVDISRLCLLSADILQSSFIPF